MEIIAELGINWEGRFDLFEELIRRAKNGGADWVKFQIYNSQKLFGDDSRKKWEISFAQLKELNDMCKYFEIPWFASVFDEERLNWCRRLKVERYKIASRTWIDDWRLVYKIIDQGKYTLISTCQKPKADATWKENVFFLECISKYPVHWNDRQRFEFNERRVGISDHSFGISRCLYAIAHGAKVIEKHFTLNKASSDSHDHMGSMDYKELCLLNTIGREVSRIYQRRIK